MDIASYIASLDWGPFTEFSLVLHLYAYSIFAVTALGVFRFVRSDEKKYSIAMAMVLVIALSVALKDAYEIPRPCAVGHPSKICPEEGDYAFPSGHTAFAFVFVGATLGTAFFPAYLIGGLVVGFSRIYLGVHTPMDVGGGAVLGILTYFICEEVVERVMSRSAESAKKNIR